MIRFESMMRKQLLSAAERGVTQIQCDYDDSNERTLNNQPMLDLGTLGSLGLSTSERYQKAIIESIQKYGTVSFPTSSQWIRHPFWVETTQRVEEVFERPVVLTRSTGLANMAFFSSFIRMDPNGTGGIIMDKDAHASLRLCADRRLEESKHLRHSRKHLILTNWKPTSKSFPKPTVK